MTDNTLSSTGIEPMIDAKQAAAALRLPYYWFADHAMRSQVPDSPLPDGRAGALPPVRTLHVGGTQCGSAKPLRGRYGYSRRGGRMIDFNDTAATRRSRSGH